VKDRAERDATVRRAVFMAGSFERRDQGSGIGDRGSGIREEGRGKREEGSG
jgi:hypothetical protein